MVILPLLHVFWSSHFQSVPEPGHTDGERTVISSHLRIGIQIQIRQYSEENGHFMRTRKVGISPLIMDLIFRTKLSFSSKMLVLAN